MATWSSAKPAQPAAPTPPAPPVTAEDLSTELLPPSQLTPPTLQSLRLPGKTQPQPSEADVNQMISHGVDSVRGGIELCISARGSVMDVKLIASTGYPNYDQKLLTTVRDWHYRPYTINSLPVPACGTVEFIYNVDD